jgi:cell division protein FtsI (penicillin-binding protein 3)
MVDEPSAGGHYGGEVAAPVFSTIVSETLRSLNISPDITDRTLVQNFEPIPTVVQAQKVVLKQ